MQLVSRAILAWALTTVSTVSIAAEDIAKVEACMKANVPEQVQVRQFEMEVTDKGGNSRSLLGRVSARQHRGRVNATLQVEAPQDLSGAAYLVVESKEEGEKELMYVYIPALRKVRRITGSMRSKSLFGTDLSYTDLKKIAYALNGEGMKLEREDNYNGRPVWVVSKPSDESEELEFDVVTGWIDKESCVMVQAEFVKSDKLVKRYSSAAEHISREGNFWYLSEAKLENIAADSSTTVRITDVYSERKLAERLFNPRTFYLGG